MTNPQQPADAPGTHTVVDMPAEIDLTNADQVGQALAAAMHSGLKVLIADLTTTTFCDVAGVRVFALARRQAIKNRTALRLVVPSSAVQRAFQAIELDRLVPIYFSLSAAMAPAVEAPSKAAAGSPGPAGAPRPGAPCDGGRRSPRPHGGRRSLPRSIISRGWKLRHRGANRA